MRKFNVDNLFKINWLLPQPHSTSQDNFQRAFGFSPNMTICVSDVPGIIHSFYLYSLGKVSTPATKSEKNIMACHFTNPRTPSSKCEPSVIFFQGWIFSSCFFPWQNFTNLSNAWDLPKSPSKFIKYIVWSL